MGDDFSTGSWRGGAATAAVGGLAEVTGTEEEEVALALRGEGLAVATVVFAVVEGVVDAFDRLGAVLAED